MHTAQNHSFVTPIAREIPPSWMRSETQRETQRDRVMASLLARPARVV